MRDVIATGRLAGHWALLAGYSAAGLIFTSDRSRSTRDFAGRCGRCERADGAVLKNLSAVLRLRAAGWRRFALHRVPEEHGDFAAMNEAYGIISSRRAGAIDGGVARLPKDVLVEIDVIALA